MQGVIESLMAGGLRGRKLAYAYTSHIDGILTDIFNELVETQNLLLIATGGYGRRELAPFSDIDIMFYAEGKNNTAPVEKILYRLWDEKLNISHAFRDSKECIFEAFSDIRTRTALMEARYIAGSRKLFEKFRKDVYSVITRSRQKQFVALKLKEMESRHRSAGDSVYLLEPHIKEGDGGLRDIHIIFWLSKIMFGIENIDDLSRIFGGHDLKRLLSAYDFMIQARYCLHIESKRRNDILSFEYQRNVADSLGFRGSLKFTGAERMMRYYYLKARIIRDLSGAFMERCSRKYAPVFRDFTRKRINEDFLISGGRLIASREDVLCCSPEKIMEAFLHFARTGKKFSGILEERIRENLMHINSRSRNNPVMVQSFIDIMKSKRVYETLREMNDMGVLGRFIPEFGALRALVVHEPYHMYTVDEHTLLAIRNLERLRTTTVRSLEPLREIILSMESLDILFLSILLHDIGKASGRHHEEEGYKKIKSIMERLNMRQERRRRTEFLVRNHVLMSRISMTREIDDPEVIAGFADSVGDIENLKAIYLLTYADMSAVNPDFWNPWKASLLRDLYDRTVLYLSGFKDANVRHDPAVIFPDDHLMQKKLSAFISSMPDRYLISTTRERLKNDFQLYLNNAGGTGASIMVETLQGGIAEITVCAADSPGLFARLAGFLSMKRLNIVHGRIYTGKTGIVIDKISLSNWKDIWWKGLEMEIVSGLEDAIVNRRDAGVTRRSASGCGIFSFFVEIDNEISDSYTLIEIFTPDRIGLLYEIAMLLYRRGIDIVSARINTERGLAQDIFSVNENGGKLSSSTVEATLKELWNVLTD